MNFIEQIRIITRKQQQKGADENLDLRLEGECSRVIGNIYDRAGYGDTRAIWHPRGDNVPILGLLAKKLESEGFRVDLHMDCDRPWMGINW